MADHGNPNLNKVYNAQTVEEQRAAYDTWASDYDRDILQYGNRAPIVAATVFARFVTPGTGPVLDAGCGTGLQTEPLVLAGHGPFVGVDLSDGMLDVARAKGLYQDLQRMTLGAPLALPDHAYSVTYCIGALTPGHAPARSFDELIRVTSKNGLMIVSLRADEGREQQTYLDAVGAHEKAGHWHQTFVTPVFASMPQADMSILHRIHVFQVLI